MNEENYRELYNLKEKLHELIKELIIITRLGSIEEEGIGGEGIESLNFDFAGGEIYSCFYYEQVRFIDSAGEEYEFDDDLGIIRRLVEEIEKRYKNFKNKTNNASKNQAIEIFGKSFEVENKEEEVENE
ncbi:MAG: hypothetical protein KJ646_05925 [Nanoarchaeota archaeon]|nr:hypothetical protein [Nanoarchaeota archaeon]MBU4116971.1 hypothetical protein [Nanoarchaeota archaeon]